MDAKIKAALLGDATAAAECTAAGIAIPCPFCGAAKIMDDGLDCYCDKCDAQASNLQFWNRRARIQSEDNPPLTLEELREMDGEPIWYLNNKHGEWCILRVVNGVYFAQSGGSNNCAVNADTYGKTWLAYRRKPDKEE